MPKLTGNTVYRAHVPVISTADQSGLLTWEPCPYLQVTSSAGSWVWKPHLLTLKLDISVLLKLTLRAVVFYAEECSLSMPHVVVKWHGKEKSVPQEHTGDAAGPLGRFPLLCLALSLPHLSNKGHTPCYASQDYG